MIFTHWLSSGPFSRRQNEPRGQGRRKRWRDRLNQAERLEPKLCLSAAAGSTSASPQWFQSLQAPADDISGERWIVRLDAASTAQSADVAGARELLQANSVPITVLRGLGLPGMLLVSSTHGHDETSRVLEDSGLAEYFVPDQSVEAQTLVPDDPEFGTSQYSFNNAGQFFGSANADINAPEAWDLFPESDPRPGSHDVVAAVIDSGVDYTHPDLARNIWLNQGEIPPSLAEVLTDTDADGLITFVDLNQPANAAHVTDSNGNGFIDAADLLSDSAWENSTDEDGNGLTDDLIGWDFLNNDNDPIDDHRHGTHVAGTIGAVGDNGLGVSGVNWDVSVMPLKFLNTQLTGSTSDAILAINYATMMRSQFDTNVRVMNASWGTLGDFNPDLQDAISAAQSADVLFVAAAGNGDVTGRGVDLDNDLGFYPASFDTDNIIAVAATDNSDNLARFSNFGATSVDLAAPGVGIFGLNLGGGFIFRTGTSMATPHVTGTVALLAALRPFAAASELRDALIESVRSVGGLSGDVATGGLLDANGALSIDTFAPRGSVTVASDVTTDGATTQDIIVKYLDDTNVDAGSLGDTDVIIRRRDDGAEFSAPLIFGPNGNGPDVDVLYRMTPPNGSWLLEDNGIYEVVLQAGEVSDTGGHLTRETVIGSFEVTIAFAGQVSVTTTADGISPGSLRAAVQTANASAGLNTIVLRPDETYVLDIAGDGEDASATGDLDITDVDGLVIRGNGATIEMAGGIDRVLDVQSSGSLTLLDVTISGGSISGGGGGVRNNGGTLTIERSLLTASSATFGGAVSTTGNTTLINTTVSGNTATNGAGIDHASGVLLLSSVSVTNNIATNEGGGIRSAANAQLQNTIIADNTATSANPDTSGSFASNGHNLVGDLGTATGLTNGTDGDQTGNSGTPIDPVLGDLKDNGGFTFTHRLLPGSPAIDTGDNSIAPSVDQRNVVRPIDADNDGTATADIGSLERNLGDIEGAKYSDDNSNGVRDEGEPGLEGWTIYLDINNNGELDVDEPSTLTIGDDPATSGTDESGMYRFTEVPPDRYVVRELQRPGWTQTGPDSEAGVFQLADLDGVTGFRVDGTPVGARTGRTVSSAGDVNGDGIDDLLIGAPYAQSPDTSSGAAYVVFGTNTGQSGNFPPTFSLGSLDGSNGFRLDGPGVKAYAGYSVTFAGDVNGDGIDDLAIGAPDLIGNDFGQDAGPGSVYVVFGKDSAQAGDFPASFNVSSLDGTTGFRVLGVTDSDSFGVAVSSAGDVNGDGIADLLIGADHADPNGTDSGAAFVVFGKDTSVDGNFPTTLNASSLDGSNGFRVNGGAGVITTVERTGHAVSAAGDINGDGVDDLAIGAYTAFGADLRSGNPGDNGDFAGFVYVVYGNSSTAFSATIELSDLDGGNGFRLEGPTGQEIGSTLSGASDVNGDGIDDIVMGASASSYVFFGRNTAQSGNFPPVTILISANLDGTTGFRLNSRFRQVSSFAGDLNGDGIGDLAVGAHRHPVDQNFGMSYVVYGRDTTQSAVSFAATETVDSLDGLTGFRFDGTTNGDFSGQGISSAGDINDDGFGDLLIGAPDADPNSQSSAGSSYVVFGGPTPVAVADDSFWTVRLQPGNTATSVDFGNVPLNGSIAGRVFRDLNTNALRDAGEAGLDNWQVFLDEDDDNQLDIGETSALTDSEGRFSFAGLDPFDTYRVVQVVQSGFEQTRPAAEDGPVIEVTLGAGEDRGDVDFGNLDTVGGVGFGSGTLEGNYFVDANADGIRNAGEGQAGVTVFLDLNNNGVRDSSGGNLEPAVTTQAEGLYRFEQLAGGTFTVRAINVAGREQQFPRNNTLDVSDVNVGDFPQSIAAGSFNGDSMPDLVVANIFTNDLSVLLGNGSSFNAADSIFTGSFQPRSVAVADFNQDGNDDLVVGHEATNVVSILLGQGNGAFATPITLTAGGGQTTVSTGLFTNDAFPDIAVASAVSNQAFVISNTNGSNFGVLHTVTTGTTPSRAEFANLEVNNQFNANSDPDLVVSSFGANRVETYFNTGGGSLSTASTVNVGTGASDIAVADFDLDGHLDVASANQFSDNITVLFNNGFNGQFDPVKTRSYPAGSGPTAIEAVDINMDGQIDLAVTNGSDSNLAVLLNLGGGVFQSPQNFGVGVFPVRLAWSVTSADFDQDGDPDLAVAKGVSNQAAILDNTLIAGAFRVILTGDGDETVSGLDFAVVELDVTPPTPVISSTESSPTNAPSIPITITFSEVVTGFLQTDVSVAGGSLNGFTDAGSGVFTLSVAPTGDGDVTLDIAANAAQDAAGNASLAATQFTFTSDRTAPEPVITATQSSPTSESPINVSVDFGEVVSGFVAGDLSIGNGTSANFATTNNRVFTFDVIPPADGTVTVNIAASAALDDAGNGSLAATQLSIESVTGQTVFLPAGGGVFELLVINTDVVLRRQGAAELLRQTVEPGLSFVITGSTADDELIVDLSALPGAGVTWNGDAGIDSLTVTGGTFELTTITNTGAADGVIAFDGFPVAFTGLEPIDLTGVTSTSMSVTLPDTSDNASLTPTGGGMLMLSSIDGSPTFEMVEFATPAGELRIDAGGGNDQVSAATVTTSVTIVGGPGDDMLTGGTADDILRGGEGTDQFDGGPGHDMIGDRAAGETTNSTLITVDTRVVVTPTSTDPDGHVAALPLNVTYLDEWDDFTIEVWGSTPDDDTTSIGSFSVDVPFDASFYEVTAVEFGPAFTDSRQSTTDNVSDIVSGISASTLTADLGRVDFVLMARVTFQVLAGANLTNSATGRYILPTVDDRLTANGVMFETAAGAESDSNEPAAPSIRIWPVMYDLDDSGEIGFGDVARFAQVFGNSTTTSDESYSRDFDRSGDVDFGDVALFAQNFGRSRASATQQSYALNFPNAWQPSALLSNTDSPVVAASLASGQQLLSPGTLRGLQYAAIDRFEEAGLSDSEIDALRSVEIRVEDLPDGYLGLATDDAIIIDIDVNGVGWFIDDTPRDDLEFAMLEQSGAAVASQARSRFDLLSVIAHELGHYAGWGHDDDGLMSERLNPGERRLPQSADTDDQFTAFSNLDELLGLS